MGSPVAWLIQAAVVTVLNVRSIGQRRGASLAALLGVAGVVAVFISVLSIAEGFQATLATTGSPETVVVFRGGTDTEMNSVLRLEETRIIADAPGVARTSDGVLASSELFVIVDLPKKATGTAANVPLRGIGRAAFEVRRGIRVVEGRSFEAGRNEMIVGSAAAGQFEGLGIGDVHRWGESEWTVVGIFEAGGTVAESELWCDAAVLQPAYRRGDTFQSVYLRLESADRFQELKDALTTDPRLDVRVIRETEYYAEQSQMISTLIRTLGALVAVIMGVGAVFGALNTMYTAVASRTREIATLRAVGFGGGPVVLSVLAESVLLSLAGGVLGGALAYLAFNGYRTSTINWQSFSQVAFAFTVTPRLLAQGIGYAVLMGLLGGLFPAVRAARIPVATALREL